MNLSKLVADDRFRKYSPLIFFSFVFFIYLLYPTRNFYWDGIYFSQVIEDARGLDGSLAHPNHLFYNSVGYVVYQAAKFCGLNIRALYILEFISGICGAASATTLYFILQRTLKIQYLT